MRSSGTDSEDDPKRKRETEEGDKIFKRSKKLSRTPPKKLNTEMEDVKVMFQQLMGEITEIRKENSHISELLAAMKEENEQIKKDLNTLESRMKEVEQLKENVDKMGKSKEENDIRLTLIENELEKAEIRNRKNNVVVTGIALNGNLVAETFFKEKLGVNVKVLTGHMIKAKSGKPMVAVKLEHWEAKEMIMENKNKLRGSNLYINHDLTKLESEIQKKLRNIALREKAKGNTAKVGYKKIYINGECWIWNQEIGDVLKAKNEQKKSKN